MFAAAAKLLDSPGHFVRVSRPILLWVISQAADRKLLSGNHLSRAKRRLLRPVTCDWCSCPRAFCAVCHG